MPHESHPRFLRLLFAAYCFNAGATVVSMRPLGHQTNEVILDNDDAAVTFSGSWSTSTSTIFWGSPGDVPYRFASFAATETATATYTPTIPVAGYYPVYCWTRHGSDRGFQLYRVRHTGGESQVRIPHHMAGNGWVYLGEYYFNAGSNAAIGSVVISNLRGTPDGSVIIADAIRFGNGMGSVDQGGGVSGYPREDENMRYWVKANLAQGQSASLYEGSGDDESDSWSAPPKMSAEMNREGAGDIYDRIHISFHSNAGGGRGTVGLITGDPPPNEADLVNIAGGEVNDDLVALGSPPLEAAWFNRTTHTYTGGYSEIDGSLFNYEMAATIIEVAFHDDPTDAMLMRDAKARAAVGKAAMHAVIKFMHQFDTNDAPMLSFLPEAPTNFRAIAGTNGQIALAWIAPVNLGRSQNPTNYVIYRSTNGYGFGNPISAGNVTSYTVTNLPANTDFYFRVSAANAGGESMPSEVVGCRASSSNGAPRVLVINGFDRFDRTANLRHDVARQSWDPPGNNHAYYASTFPGGQTAPAVQSQGGALAVGTIGFAWLDVIISKTGSTVEWFINGLKIATITGAISTSSNIFLGYWDYFPSISDNTNLSFGLFDNVRVERFVTNVPPYITTQPQCLTVTQNNNPTFSVTTGGTAALAYQWRLNGTNLAAATQSSYTRSNVQTDDEGSYSVLVANASGSVTSSVANLTVLVPPSISQQPQSQAVKPGTNVIFSVVATGTAPLGYQWWFNGTNLAGGTDSSFTRANVQTGDAGEYSVVVTNPVGTAISSNAVLTILPLQPLKFDGISLLSDRRVQLILSGEPGSYVNEQASDLTNWSPLITVTNTGSPSVVIDDSSTNTPQRIYRASPAP